MRRSRGKGFADRSGSGSGSGLGLGMRGEEEIGVVYIHRDKLFGVGGGEKAN